MTWLAKGSKVEDIYPFRVMFVKSNWSSMSEAFPDMMEWLYDTQTADWRWTILGHVENDYSRHYVAILFAKEAQAVECKLRFT